MYISYAFVLYSETESCAKLYTPTLVDDPYLKQYLVFLEMGRGLYFSKWVSLLVGNLFFIGI